jgi:hypothetical protein
MFAVEDLDGIISRMRARGTELIGRMQYATPTASPTSADPKASSSASRRKLQKRPSPNESAPARPAARNQTPDRPPASQDAKHIAPSPAMIMTTLQEPT